MIKFLLLNLSLSVLSFSAYADSENGLQRLKDCEVFDVTTQLSELGLCKNLIIESYERDEKGNEKVPKKLKLKTEAGSDSDCVEVNAQYSVCDAPIVKEEPFDCTTELMSEPTCMDRLNAARTCKGQKTKAFSTVITDCVKKYEGMLRSKSNAIAMCTGGYTSSTKKEDNETLCNNAPKSKPEAINDSKMPKTLDASDYGSVKKPSKALAK